MLVSLRPPSQLVHSSLHNLIFQRPPSHLDLTLTFNQFHEKLFSFRAHPPLTMLVRFIYFTLKHFNIMPPRESLDSKESNTNASILT